MKVNWDKIISENYKPSKMVGGYSILNFLNDFADITGLSLLTHPIQRPHPDDLTVPNPNLLPYDLRDIPTHEEREQKILEDRMRRQEQWLLGEIPKELKQQEEEARLTRDSHNRLLLLRNEQNRKAEAARLLARNKAISAQSAARLQAAQKGTANIQDYLARVQAVAAASAATRAQNLQSLHALATQKAAASAAEAEQQRAIHANSAQILAQQNAEVARLRAEAMAKQAQLVKTPTATAPVGRKAKAPQVKFGGSKSSGYVQKLIEMDKLDPEAELFDADLIQDPSKYIQTQLYEKSGRVRQGIKKIKEIQQKNIVKSAVKKYVLSFKNRSIGAIKNIDENTMEEFMNSFKRDGVEGAAYSAFSIVGELFFLHLLRKYKNDCYVVSKTEKNLYIAGISIRDSLAGIKTDDTDFPEILDDCIKSKSPLIVIPFNLPGHQNMLIYRPQQNTMERFEPHGEQTGFSASPAVNKKKNEKIDETLTIYFNHKRFDKVFIRPGVPPFKYLNAAELKLGRGFQSIEGEQKRAYGKKLGVGYEGFCMMWSYFYLELCMRFPNMTGKEVIDRAFQILETRGAQGFLNHILAYLEGSEKEIAKIVKDFSFKTIQSTRGSKKSAALSALRSYRDWYDKQITEIVESKKKQRGGELICSCNGPSTCGGVK